MKINRSFSVVVERVHSDLHRPARGRKVVFIDVQELQAVRNFRLRVIVERSGQQVAAVKTAEDHLIGDELGGDVASLPKWGRQFGRGELQPIAQQTAAAAAAGLPLADLLLDLRATLAAALQLHLAFKKYFRNCCKWFNKQTKSLSVNLQTWYKKSWWPLGWPLTEWRL